MNQLFTAEHIHSAYVAAVPRSAKPWDEVADGTVPQHPGGHHTRLA